MIQDIAPSQMHNSYHPRPPRFSDVVLAFYKDTVLLKDEHTPFHVQDYHKDDLTYLFTIDTTAYYLTNHLDTTFALSIQNFRSHKDKALAFAIVSAYHLDAWYKNNRFCGRCGHRYIHDTKERALRCPLCANIIYPRINPAVIVGVLNRKNQLLVTKYAHGNYRKHALVAGYCEFGETVEETVAREVKEETGLDVTQIQYFGSQPWGYSSSILMGFWARVNGEDTIVLDENELSYASFVDQDELIETGSNASLTSFMIQKFKEGDFPK